MERVGFQQQDLEHQHGHQQMRAQLREVPAMLASEYESGKHEEFIISVFKILYNSYTIK